MANPSSTNAAGGISDMDSGDGNELTPRSMEAGRHGSRWNQRPDLYRWRPGTMKNAAGDLNPTTRTLWVWVITR